MTLLVTALQLHCVRCCIIQTVFKSLAYVMAAVKKQEAQLVLG